MNRSVTLGLTTFIVARKLQTMTTKISEQTMVEEVERRLAGKYADVPAERISAIVEGAYAQFGHSRIRDFVPLFVERRARAELAKAKEQVSVPLPT